MIKLKVKTKEQLLEQGWQENTRSIYARLYIDGISQKGRRVKRRMRNNPVGCLSDFQVNHILGKEARLIDIVHLGEMPYFVVSVNLGDTKVEANIPYSAFNKMTDKKLAKIIDKLKDNKIKTKIDHTVLRYNKSSKTIKVGCKTFTFKTAQKVFNELKEAGVIK